jgi:hypothetical protein
MVAAARKIAILFFMSTPPSKPFFEHDEADVSPPPLARDA